jgi:single-stranded DNA-binding protein
MATSSGYKAKNGEWNNHTDWHRVACFGPTVSYAKELKSGDYAEVHGELSCHQYEVTPEETRRSWEVRASKVVKLPPYEAAKKADKAE